MSAQWVAAIDAWRAAIGEQRNHLAEIAAGERELDDTMPPFTFTFDPELGPLPPALAVVAQAAVAEALVLQDELSTLRRMVERRLPEGGARRPTPAPARTGRRLDVSA